jgi:hypothetical protein
MAESRSNFDYALNKLLWQMNLLKTDTKVPSTIKTIFTPPKIFPPYSVVSSLLKSDLDRMNEQQLIYTLLKSYSTIQSSEASLDTLSRSIAFHESNISQIDKGLVDIKKKQAISYTTIENLKVAGAKYKESSILSQKLIVPLKVQYTNLSTSLVQNTANYTNVNNELTTLKYKIAQYEANTIRDNPGYIYSTIMLATLKKEYISNANAMSSIKKNSISLANETIRTAAIYATATKERGAAESTLSTIDGNILRYSIVNKNSYITGIEQRTVSTIAGLEYNKDQLYYILSKFYVSSNDLKKQLDTLGQSQQSGGNLIESASDAMKQGGGSAAAAAYDMAKYSYYHIGGQTQTIKQLYDSTVTGIAKFEENMFSIISAYSDTQIEVAKKSADTYTTMKQDAQKDIDVCIRKVDDLTVKKKKYETSSLEIEALIKKNMINVQTTRDAIPPLISARNFAATALDQFTADFKNCSTQYDTIVLELANNIEISTTNGRIIESIDVELPKKQAEYDELLESYTNTGGEISDLQFQIETNSKIYKINTRYQETATYKAVLADRLLNYYTILNIIAEERIKETDARAARTELADQLKERLIQLQTVAGSEPPDLTDPTYDSLSSRMSKLNIFIDNNYDEFYKVGDEFSSLLSAYEELIDLINMTGASFIDLQIQQDQTPDDTATITAFQATKNQIESLKADEAIRKTNLDKLKDQILKYESILKSNRDIFIPGNVQQATQELINATQSSIPESLPEPGPPS